LKIHPSSVVSKEAEIADDVEIGPFCAIVGKVKIGSGCKLVSHVSIGSEFGIVEIGKNNLFAAGCVVGGPPQDLKYKGEPTKLIIGDNNMIREMATLNIGTPTGGGVSQIGNGCLIMAYVHVAHDCILGNNVVIANSTQLAGHVTIEDFARIGGVCAISQFCRIGKFAFVAGDSAINKAQGRYAVIRATNRIGLERAGYKKEDIESVNRAIRILTKGSSTVAEALERIDKECPKSDALDYLLNFIRSSERGLALVG
jgi:UDP-N-acetylglucosamine acyltransferase